MDESWETNSSTIKDDFNKLAIAANVIENECENEYLLAELKPWLKQAKFVGERGLKAIDL